MKKIIFIVPYFGSWPSYFREWVYTAGYLEKQFIDFVLVSDIEIPFELPSNISQIKMSIEELRARIQSLYDFEISLETPYKLCDYRPAFGYIFTDIVCGYDFWGHCDLDMIWGDVRHFISDKILETYEKIQYLGHFVLYRNNDKMNSLYKCKGGMFYYKEVFSSPEFYSFDEHPGMMLIASKNNIRTYVKTNQADISPQMSRMTISRVANYQYQILYWKEGHVFRCFIDNYGNLQSEEYMYAHFQQKKPKSLIGSIEKTPKAFYFRTDGFCVLQENRLSADYLRSISDYQSEEIDSRERKNYKKQKIRHFINCSFRKKEIWLRIRIGTRKVNRLLTDCRYRSSEKVI